MIANIVDIINLLKSSGFLWGEVQEGLLAQYLGEIREWNAYASLVSQGDLQKLEGHVVDSLSLGPLIQAMGGGTILDIGSGSGFPAIPLAILFSSVDAIASSHPEGVPRNDMVREGEAPAEPSNKISNDLDLTARQEPRPPEFTLNEMVQSPVRFILVERSEKKAGFLRQAASDLGLPEVAVVLGEFPHVVKDRKADIITARAVERPEKVIKGIIPFIKDRGMYLCQSGDPSRWLRGMFHVEPVVDAWSDAGLRRGSLYCVRRKEPE